MTNAESLPAKGLRRALRKVRADVCKVAESVDLFDGVAVVGLGMLFHGLYAIFPPAAWIIVGGMLLRVGSTNSLPPMPPGNQ